MQQGDRRSNWGRWGADDERGSLNLIDSRTVTTALSRAKLGHVIELGGRIDEHTPVPAFRPRPNLSMRMDGGDEVSSRINGKTRRASIADDVIFMAPQTGTHVDSLCHVFVDGKMYNGFDASEVRSAGSRRCGAEKMQSVVTTGALFNIPAITGEDAMRGGYEITSQVLTEAAARQGIGRLPPGRPL